MSENPEAALLLISDLHFGADLLSEAEGSLIDAPRFLGLSPDRIQEFINKRCAAHDLGILKSLPRYLRRVLEDIPYPDGTPRNAFDLCLVLGDLATRPSSATYSFLRQYMTQAVYETGDRDLSHRCAGLNLSSGQLVAIPGNHDKLLKTSLRLYQEAFLKQLGTTLEPRPQSCFVISRQVRGIQFVFFLVEASKYAKEDDRVDASCREHLAGGEITDDLRSEIREKLRRVKEGQKVDCADSVEDSNATKVLLVHYGVDVSQVVGHNVGQLVVPHECTGLDNLVEDLASDFNVVIHGHLHKPRLYTHEGVPVVAVSTTTQRSQDRENGFFILKFFRSGEVRAEHHRWLGTGFLADDRTELNQILYGPRGNAASAS